MSITRDAASTGRSTGLSTGVRRALTGVVGVGVAGLLSRVPAILEALPACPSRLLLAVDCPFCGATRAAQDVLAGDVWAAVGHNVFMALTGVMLLVMWVAWVREGATGRSRPAWMTAPRTFNAWVVVGLVFAALRNVPLPGLEWLAAAPVG